MYRQAQLSGGPSNVCSCHRRHGPDHTGTNGNPNLSQGATPVPMFQPNPPSGYHLTRREQHSRQFRVQRATYFKSPKGQRLYARRHRSVEPFNEWFKQMFDLSDHVWHRGINNNKTQVLGAIFTYQLLLRYNHNCGNRNGQVQWILDGL